MPPTTRISCRKSSVTSTGRTGPDALPTTAGSAGGGQVTLNTAHATFRPMSVLLGENTPPAQHRSTLNRLADWIIARIEDVLRWVTSSWVGHALIALLVIGVCGTLFVKWLFGSGDARAAPSWR